ncbi:MAG: hypothetical protein AAF583_08640 [Pseudomonadota bacterium]
MRDVAVDFEKRVAELSRKNRWTVRVMFGLIFAAGLAYAVFICAQLANGAFGLTTGQFGNLLGDGAGNALWAANNMANLAATAALRIWFIRERKMTLLLTHAMVLDNDDDIAMRILLNEDTRT